MNRTDTLSGTTLALACLALGHEHTLDHDCTAGVEQIVGDLVREVRRLRTRLGEEPDTAGAADAVREALDAVDSLWLDQAARSTTLVEHLADEGWQLVPVDR